VKRNAVKIAAKHSVQDHVTHHEDMPIQNYSRLDTALEHLKAVHTKQQTQK